MKFLLHSRLLSNATDAPYLGEASIVYILTRQPAPNIATQTGGSIPLLTYLLLTFYLGMGLLTLKLSLRELKDLLPNRHLKLSPAASPDTPVPIYVAVHIMENQDP